MQIEFDVGGDCYTLWFVWPKNWGKKVSAPGVDKSLNTVVACFGGN